MNDKIDTGSLSSDLEVLVDKANDEMIANIQNEGRVAFAKGQEPDSYPPELDSSGRHEWLHGYYAAKAEALKPKAPQRKSPAKRVARAERIGTGAYIDGKWVPDAVTPKGNEGEHSGGSVSYYVVDVMHPTHQSAPYTAECNDIIEALQMDYAEGNVFKAIWRSAAARQGKLKKGHDAKYDAEKIVFYGQRLLERAINYLKG